MCVFCHTKTTENVLNFRVRFFVYYLSPQTDVITNNLNSFFIIIRGINWVIDVRMALPEPQNMPY